MHILNTRIALPAALTVLGLAGLVGCWQGRALYSVPAVLGVSPPSAPVGTNVVITGAYFKGVSEVSFGGATAPFYQVNSPQQITATVPQAAISGTVEVTNPAGTGDYTRDTGTPSSNGQSFTVVPAITGIVPTSGPAGTAVTVTGSGFFGVTSVIVGTDTTGSSSVTYNDPNQVTVIVGAGATTGAVVLTVAGLQATGPAFTVQ